MTLSANLIVALRAVNMTGPQGMTAPPFTGFLIGVAATIIGLIERTPS